MLRISVSSYGLVGSSATAVEPGVQALSHIGFDISAAGYAKEAFAATLSGNAILKYGKSERS
jgi:hypothetical protein